MTEKCHCGQTTAANCARYIKNKKMVTVHDTSYFPSYSQAREIMERYCGADARLVNYCRGWAIQHRISGPYYPEAA